VRDNRGKPQKSGWTFDFGSPWKPGPDKRDEPPADYEPFPRLGASEEPPASGGKINGAWGWVLLVVPIVLLMAFAFVPTAAMAEEESNSSGLEVAISCLSGSGLTSRAHSSPSSATARHYLDVPCNLRLHRLHFHRATGRFLKRLGCRNVRLGRGRLRDALCRPPARACPAHRERTDNEPRLSRPYS
jgi:hypothetical protein